jgi:O-antigen/teichoic acid export membrane protein
VSTLLKGSAIYTLGSLLRQLVSFLMLPIYTRHLTPTDYGVSEMLGMITAVLAVLAGTHMGMATIRFFHDAGSEQQQKTVINTASITTVATTSIVYLIFLCVCFSQMGPLVSHYTLGSEKYLTLLKLFGLMVIFQPVEEQLFTLLRIRNRPWLFVLLSIGKLIVQLSLAVYFVVLRDLGVAGIVYSGVLSGGLMALVSFVTCRAYSGWGFSLDTSLKMLRFVVPLAIGGIGLLYFTVSDRYAIQFLAGADHVGLYALGYRFADILFVVGWIPFLSIWQAYRFEIAKTETALEEYGNVFCIVSAYLIWIALGIALLTDKVLHLVAAQAYWSAAEITPPLLLSLLLACAIGFCNFSFLFSGKTSYIAKGSWLSAVALTLFFALFIPSYGAVGAAWARVISSMFLLGVTLYWSRAVYPMNLPWGRVSILLSLCVAIYIGVARLPFDEIVSVAISLVVLMTYPFAVVLLPILPEKSRTIMKNYASKFVKNALEIIAPVRARQ